MQFHLQPEELNVLLEAVQEEPGPAHALLDRLIERDMRFAFDELGDLADVLDVHIRKLREKLAATPAGAARSELERKRKVLEHALDRVKECLAMV